MSPDGYIYMDSAAAMPVIPEMLELFTSYSLKYPANPEAVHGAGRNSATVLKEGADRLLSALTGDSYSLAWASSATEAINTVFSSPYFQGRVVVRSDSEHPVVEHAVQRAGFCDIRKVPVMQNGLLDMDEFEKQIDADVAAVVIHHVQNETGAVQDLCGIRRIINMKSPGALLIVDTVQSVAKIAIPWEEAEINIAFIGGHKIGAPAGGALIYNFYDNSVLDRDFRRHFRDFRSVAHSIGRPDTAVCLTLADAVVYAESGNMLCKASYLNRIMRAKLADFAKEHGVDITVPVPEDSASPYIVTFLMPPYQAEVIVRMLSDKGVMVSAGSACEASKTAPSQALTAIAGSPKTARTAIRVSFSFNSKADDIDQFISSLAEAVKEY